jgi:hypothetical protein
MVHVIKKCGGIKTSKARDEQPICNKVLKEDRNDMPRENSLSGTW